MASSPCQIIASKLQPDGAHDALEEMRAALADRPVETLCDAVLLAEELAVVMLETDGSGSLADRMARNLLEGLRDLRRAQIEAHDLRRAELVERANPEMRVVPPDLVG